MLGLNIATKRARSISWKSQGGCFFMWPSSKEPQKVLKITRDFLKMIIHSYVVSPEVEPSFPLLGRHIFGFLNMLSGKQTTSNKTYIFAA
jgi:hypothetical protein